MGPQSYTGEMSWNKYQLIESGSLEETARDVVEFRGLAARARAPYLRGTVPQRITSIASNDLLFLWLNHAWESLSKLTACSASTFCKGPFLLRRSINAVDARCH